MFVTTVGVFVSEVSTAILDAEWLIARAAQSVAALQSLGAESRRLIVQSAKLCGMARRIRGGSDLDSPFIVEIIAKASMCLPCVAGKTGIAPVRIAEAIERIRAFMVVQEAAARCAGCLQVTTTYQIPDHDNGSGAPPARPVQTRLNDALWRFLEDHRAQMFCTQCIANALFATRRIDRAVLGAEGRGARRRYGTCVSCGKERLLCGLAR